MDLIEDRVQQLLDSIGSSVVQSSLVVFFYRNPGAFDTTEGLARWVGINQYEVEPALEELNKTGIVKKMGNDLLAIYTYSPEESVLEIMDELVAQLTAMPEYSKEVDRGQRG
ncbi:MAG: hypothetical protein ACOX5W_10530 [Bacillota bacterium]|jgi:O-methyltransferase involved in polyketide biosynthesis